MARLPHSGSFKKGPDKRRSPGGLTREIRAAGDALRAALEQDGPRIHEALMRLVDADNSPAIIYAHTQLIGKPKDRVEVSGDALVLAWMAKLTPEQAIAIAKGEGTPELESEPEHE